MEQQKHEIRFDLHETGRAFLNNQASMTPAQYEAFNREMDEEANAIYEREQARKCRK